MSLSQKGLEFVGIDPRIDRDERIVAIAVALGKDPYWVAGHMPRFLGEVAEQRPTGDLSGLHDFLLDNWAGGVEGWGAQVRAHLCDEHGVLRAWEKFNGRAMRKLEADRQRKRNERELKRQQREAEGQTGRGHSAKKNPGTVHGHGQGPSTDAGTDVPSPGARTVPGKSALTVTETDLTTSQHSARVREVVEKFLGDVEKRAAEHRELFTTVLAELQHPDALVQELRKMELGSTTERAIPLEIIARALVQQRGNGQPLSIEGLRIYGERLMRPQRVVTDRAPPRAPRTAVPARTEIPEL